MSQIYKGLAHITNKELDAMPLTAIYISKVPESNSFIDGSVQYTYKICLKIIFNKHNVQKIFRKIDF